MKTQLSNVSLALLVALALSWSVVPAMADQTLYDNGPVNGEIGSWSINFGSIVSDSFALGKAAQIKAISFAVWEFPGDKVLSVGWSITSLPNGGFTYGSGPASAAVDYFLKVNEQGYDIDQITVSGLNVDLAAGSYWLNLQNVVTASGDPVGWDENSGAGCGGSNGSGADCPSQAAASGVGTIPSESFQLGGTTGAGGQTPEPSTLMLLGSGVLGLAGFTRRRRAG